MSRKFLTPIDLTKLELLNARIQNLASPPAAAAADKGLTYFNTTDNTLYWWDGTVWVAAKAGTAINFGSVVAETTFGGTAADGVAVTAARSDHKHANPLHDAAAHAGIPINALAGATGPIDMNGFVIGEVGTPVQPTDAANKGYVDNAIAGLSWKEAVRAASTAQVALTGLVAIDGVTPVANDRILLKNQTAPAENGIWVAAAGAWSRATDADSSAELNGAAVYVEEGTANGDTAWSLSTNLPITVGTTALSWVQFAGGGTITAGAGMTQAGNTLNVVAGDTTLTVGADSMIVNTAVIATVAGSVPTARTITAGAGLTGGGDLSANRTIDVVAGDATIVVAADSITRAALTGDVTTAVNVATISPNAVTNAKLADMATATFKGRVTAATGDPEDLTVAQMQTALGILTAAAAQGLFNKTVAVDCAAALATTVTHNFNTRDVTVEVYRTTTPWDSVEADIERTTVNTVDVRFAVAPTAAQYRIVVQGVDG